MLTVERQIMYFPIQVYPKLYHFRAILFTQRVLINRVRRKSKSVSTSLYCITESYLKMLLVSDICLTGGGQWEVGHNRCREAAFFFEGQQARGRTVVRLCQNYTKLHFVTQVGVDRGARVFDRGHRNEFRPFSSKIQGGWRKGKADYKIYFKLIYLLKYFRFNQG